MPTLDANGSRMSMTSAQRSVAVDDNRTQHVRLFFAIYRLDSCLGQATPGRLQQWSADVHEALNLLLSAMLESSECVCLDQGLIEEIRFTTPRLLNRIDDLRAEFEGLIAQANAVQRELSHNISEENANYADFRQRLGWLLAAVKHHQAKEVDLVFEAIQVDIGVGN